MKGRSFKRRVFFITSIFLAILAAAALIFTPLSAQRATLALDDLIATGGTALAAVKLIEGLGATVVGASFVIDLPELGGMRKLRELGLQAEALCAFEGH